MRRCKYPFNIPVTNHQVTKSHKNLERAQKGTSIGLSFMDERTARAPESTSQKPEAEQKNLPPTQISYTGNVEIIAT